MGQPYLVVRAVIEPDVLGMFRSWYRRVHLPHMLRIPGIVGAFTLRRGTGDSGSDYLAAFPFSDDKAIRRALASPQAAEARQDWLPWMPYVSQISIEIYADLAPLPAYRHRN